MARTGLNGDMNGQFLKSFCIFLGKSLLVRSVEHRRRVHPLSKEASQEGRRCRTALVTNNYLAGMGHPPWLGNIPERRFMVFGDQQPFSDYNPKVIDGQHWRCSIK